MVFAGRKSWSNATELYEVLNKSLFLTYFFLSEERKVASITGNTRHVTKRNTLHSPKRHPYFFVPYVPPGLARGVWAFACPSHGLVDLVLSSLSLETAMLGLKRRGWFDIERR